MTNYFLAGPAGLNEKGYTPSATETHSSTVAQVGSGAAGGGPDDKKDSGIGGIIQMVVMIALMIGLFYFMFIRPQRKKDKESKELRESLAVGDEITTIGGVIGRVVAFKDEDQLIIETGTDKTKMRIYRWAIQKKNTISD